jgi:hypothetical protein
MFVKKDLDFLGGENHDSRAQSTDSEIKVPYYKYQLVLINRYQTCYKQMSNIAKNKNSSKVAKLKRLICMDIARIGPESAFLIFPAFLPSKSPRHSHPSSFDRLNMED